MKQILKKTLYIGIILSNIYSYTTDSIITIFIQKYPYLTKSEIKKLKKQGKSSSLSNYSRALKQPDYLYRDVVSSYKHTYELPAIMCMYAGNIALSSPDGQISFPLLQQTHDMHILITEKIIPAYIVAPGTVNNWMIDPKHPHEMYFMKLEFDKKTNLYYYQTSKIDPAQNNNIPLNTIIFIADPQTMYIPIGATITQASPNIVLPTIYIKKDFCFIKNTLFTLATNQYFKSTNPSIKQDDQTIAFIQQPNG
ncbi:hypothetical protein HYV10_03860 [Candidatus Dependentiae bacterium]|nr:hypothetical protein [Candidatus Dependentiae bacterium]